jgi:branched-chain amino acid transport system ATP-binding protein
MSAAADTLAAAPVLPAAAARSEPMLSVERIRTFHGETQVLFDVSLDVAAGEVVALLGPNGAGKTTTLRSILGLTPARSGMIRFDGREVTRLGTHEIARNGIGWVPDDRRIFPTLTVARNLAIARKKTRFRAWSEKDCFEIFSALEYLMHRECENLSGGEMQMVAISRALIGAPGLVLFDEPSQGLAPKVVQDVMKTIARLRAEGIAVLLVEQNVQSALAVADRVYVMNGGVIVHQGQAAQLRDDPALRLRLLGV